MIAKQKSKFSSRHLSLEQLDRRDLLATFLVNTIADSGQGSLRSAIEQSNSSVGADTINFNIAGGGTKVLTLQTPLPAITDSVTIDGYTQPGSSKNTLANGWNGQVRIFLTPGFNTGAYGLQLKANNNVIRGLHIDGFNGDTDYADNEDVGFQDNGMAILVDQSSGNIIEGNVIQANAESGIFIRQASGNRIGGATPSSRNLIIENREHGIVIFGQSSFDNKIQGNFIGTKSGGDANPNGFAGVRLMRGAMNNTIGGINAGEGNVISGNDHWGIQIAGEPQIGPITIPTNNLVQGNLIGLKASGLAALPNKEAGVYLRGSNANTIGGDTPSARNVISGNTKDGILVSGAADTISGNFVGLNRLGTSAIANMQSGVHILNAMTGATIGGATAGAGNIISGNQVGILNDAGNSQVQIVGNFVGTNPTGQFAIPNSDAGILLAGAGVSIGGEDKALSNLISGNNGPGIKSVAGGSASVKGNVIGLNAVGDATIPNKVAGVLLENGSIYMSGASLKLNQADKITAPNTIAGNLGPGVWIKGNSNAFVIGNNIGVSTTVPNVSGPVAFPNIGAGVRIDNSPNNKLYSNIIGGNTMDGVLIQGSAATNNEVRTNRIGFNDKVGNGGDGIRLVNAPGNKIGGANVQEYGTFNGNYISANLANGISIVGINAINNQIVGNTVGGGEGAISNYGNLKSGISINNGAAQNIIDSNLVWGNKQDGVLISGPLTSANTLTKNYIGVAALASQVPGNLGHGVHIVGATGNTIGTLNGTNVIANNMGFGIAIEGGAKSNTIHSNYIGYDFEHPAAGNKAGGILVSASSDNYVGGPLLADSNRIAGNLGNGITIQGSSSSHNTIQGNEIGVLAQAELGNSADGILIDNAPENTIGGLEPHAGNVVRFNQNGITLRGANAVNNRVLGNTLGSEVGFFKRQGNKGTGILIDRASYNQIGGLGEGAANTIVASGFAGIEIKGVTSDHNTIEGNFVGVNSLGKASFGNDGPGVRIDAAALNTVHNNRIENNGGDGIAVVKNSAIGNSLRFNQLENNGGLGIDLADDGVTPNDASDSDVGPNTRQNFPVLNSAIAQADGLKIGGSLSSYPRRLYDVDFYSNVQSDPTGYGEGKVYLGTVRVLTNSQGVAIFSIKFPAGITTGQLTATATQVERNSPSTSEFSLNVPIETPSVAAQAYMPVMLAGKQEQANRGDIVAQFYAAYGALPYEALYGPNLEQAIHKISVARTRSGTL